MFLCVGLNLRTLRNPCDQARANGTFACDGCLGAVVEDTDMGGKVLCNIKGCEKWAQIGGLCRAHAHGTKPRAGIKKAVPAVVEPDPVVSAAEVHVVDLLDLVRQRLQADMDEDLAEVSRMLCAADTPMDKMKLVFDRIWS